jgi:hypothetical protein
VSGSPKTLFDLVVDQKDVHPSFENLRTQGGSAPARWMLDRVFQHFSDPDGNFVQQFQSSGFDARFFELYLFAYFYYSGFEIDRSHEAPDFLVSRNVVTAAVEATTVNAPTRGVLADLGKQIGDLSGAEMAEYQRHELPIRFGSPLFSKLNKRYWDLPNVQGLPFVLAIEAFHDEDSLGLGDSALASYLYGFTHEAAWNAGGELAIEFDRIYSHVLGTKQIPSAFFTQPDTENVSAVLFTNTGTTAKFGRMAYQAGIGGDTIEMQRIGYCSNLDEDVRDPTFFSYDVADPPVVEWWGQGLVVLHNPNCKYPLDIDFFPGAVHTFFEGGKPRSFIPNWHVFNSKTLIFDMGEVKKKLKEILPPRMPRHAVGGITKEEFHDWTSFATPPWALEDGWFCDESMALVGVVLADTRDGTWAVVVLGRDEFFEFYQLETTASIRSRFDAVRAVQERIAVRLSQPQRIFPR